MTDRLDSRIAEVAALSANFGFLLAHQPLLVLSGAEAEVRIFTDPGRSLANSREFGVILATDLLHRAAIATLGDSQATRLQALTRAGFLDQRIRGDFDAIGRVSDDPPWKGQPRNCRRSVLFAGVLSSASGFTDYSAVIGS